MIDLQQAGEWAEAGLEGFFGFTSIAGHFVAVLEADRHGITEIVVPRATIDLAAHGGNVLAAAVVRGETDGISQTDQRQTSPRMSVPAATEKDSARSGKTALPSTRGQEPAA